MAKIEQWSPEKAKTELAKRLRRAKAYREQFEPEWREIDRVVFSNTGSAEHNVAEGFTETSTSESSGDVQFGTNYSFRYLRFIHSQMSANPPSVIPSPTSPDISDRRKADAADRLVRYCRKQYNIQEVMDAWTLQTLKNGTGWLKVGWDPDAGPVRATEDDDTTVILDGDKKICVPSTWDVWADPDAKTMDSVRFVFERVEMPLEEAEFRFPEHKDKLAELAGPRKKSWKFWSKDESQSRSEQDLVEVYEYTEKKLPWNGMAGRHCWLLEDGEQLTPLAPSNVPDRDLNYVGLTDVDVSDQVYGKSFLAYLLPLQDTINRLDSSVLEAIQAHNVVRMVLPDGAEVEDESVSNSSWDYLKMTGGAGQGPYYINPPTLMTDVPKFRAQLKEDLEAIAGVNESMFGQASREMSGFASQTAINAGNMIRRRLFNKYTAGTERAYRLMLGWVKQEWKSRRMVLVLGKEMAFESVAMSGADIENGFDLIVEYGASLSLDPSSRREEIMQLQPLFEKAGVTPKTVLGMIRLNELGELYDLAKLSELRQQEIFDEMIAKYQDGIDSYIAPEDLEEHQGMLQYAYQFRMSAAYKYLELPLRQMIDKHIKDREALAAGPVGGGSGGAAQGAPSQAQDPMAAAMAGLPAQLGGMVPPPQA